ncbi:AbrB/MazE/SpoVT family DNA-binding domain-containing protein [Candidatus Pacearchaeota archaeon]|nr:AbrB/MazE/SpoVT family DNA-binding domain-containing protein [Candidatus Pacearchaeota archaeon]
METEITKISSKGQVVIPLRIRNELGINKGSILAVEKMNDLVILKKIDVDLIKQFKNSLEDVKKGRIKRVA